MLTTWEDDLHKNEVFKFQKGQSFGMSQDVSLAVSGPTVWDVPECGGWTCDVNEILDLGRRKVDTHHNLISVPIM